MCAVLSVSAQNDSLTRHEISFQFDNDLLFFDAGDRYYTNGLFLTYRQVPRANTWAYNPLRFNQLHKSLWSFSFVSKIYNPYNLKGEEEDEIDRPYAGLLYVESDMVTFWGKNALSLGLDLGWMGSATHTGKVQYSLHQAFGWVRPRGWGEYQINNSPVVDASASLQREWVHTAGFSMLSAINLQLGSVRNASDVGLMFRLGRQLEQHQSTLTYSRVGSSGKRTKKLQEIYFYSRTQISRVFYDATIEGNWIGENSPFVKEAVPWVVTQTVGLMLSGGKTDFHALWSVLGKEVYGGQRHKYGTLLISRRF
ncbi:lipid A deacylase LpxR family protein [Reichenbachiella sp. 5M10]|uniref:lipid A deacylase LpxR family protein n=1 Tax=Reichenbachiella sp. 5M10 TaxID=1889772 RepID=UPI001C8766ED|nr:lipid A deacylase LpxR family protein [Reichenbachiella sp. 5M10]